MKLLLKQTKETFDQLRGPRYAALFVLSLIVIYILLSLVPHMREISEISEFDMLVGADGTVILALLWSLLMHSATNTFLVTLIVSVLSACNIVLLVRYYQLHGEVLLKTSGKGVFGMILGVLGIGCSACGTLALTAVLGTLGLGWIVTFLPFHGMEIYLIGIGLLLFSMYQLNALIHKPLTC